MTTTYDAIIIGTGQAIMSNTIPQTSDLDVLNRELQVVFDRMRLTAAKENES